MSDFQILLIFLGCIGIAVAYVWLCEKVRG